MEEVRNTLGTELKNLRIGRGLTIEQLEAKMGCRPGYLLQLEEGALDPSDEFLHRLVEELGGSTATYDALKRLEPPATSTDDDATASGVWEVRGSSGQTRTYADVEAIRRAIVAGEIKLETEARRRAHGAESVEPAWQPASKGMVRSQPAIEILFWPVWVHMKAGARLGVLAGVAFWFLSNALFWLFNSTGAFAGFLFACSLSLAIWWGLAIMPARTRASIASTSIARIGLVLLGLMIVRAFVELRGQGLDFAIGFLLGSTAGGGIAGLALGVLVGTLVGVVRSRRLPRAPGAPTEGRTVLVGLVAPLALTVVLAAAVIPVVLRMLDCSPASTSIETSDGLPRWVTGALFGALVGGFFGLTVGVRNLLARQ